MLAAFAITTPMPVAAQMVDIPIWSNGILGQQALRNTYDNYNKANGIDVDEAEKPRECSADALPAADRRAMEAEYVRRARDDGKASADAWVHEQGRRFHLKLVEEGICPAPSEPTKKIADKSGKSELLDKDGKRCTRTRLENRPIANLGGGGMTLGLVPVCAN